MILHGIAFALLYIGLNQPRQVDPKSERQRFTVRIMELDKPEPRPVQAGASLAAPGQEASAELAKVGGSQNQAPAPRLPHEFVAQKDAQRTLIQPVERKAMIAREVPLPQIVQWSPPDPTMNKIVAPPPQVLVKVDVKPTLDLPNREMHVAELKLSSTPFEAKAPMPAPSKTSPVNVQSPVTQAPRVPETASKNASNPTSGSVISLSEVQLQKGTAVLPMVSEIAPTPYSGPMSPGQPNSLSPNGTGRTDAKQTGASASGQTPGNQAGANAGKSGAVGLNGSNANAAGKGGANGGANGTAGAGTGGGVGGQGGTNMAMAGELGINADTGGPSVVHLGLPRNGKFGVVVVGSAMAEDYPETADLWRGRLAYTVYLHVGVAKNWILQYSLPRSDMAEMTGDGAHLEAPWPFDITRPSIDADANADAIIVHGFVNAVGRFEKLSVIFPTGLAETKFLLHALQQWEFRPAMETGKATLVEILLVIPAESQ
jgi:hypothetical protein